MCLTSSCMFKIVLVLQKNFKNLKIDITHLLISYDTQLLFQKTRPSNLKKLSSYSDFKFEKKYFKKFSEFLESKSANFQNFFNKKF